MKKNPGSNRRVSGSGQKRFFLISAALLLLAWLPTVSAQSALLTSSVIDTGQTIMGIKDAANVENFAFSVERIQGTGSKPVVCAHKATLTRLQDIASLDLLTNAIIGKVLPDLTLLQMQPNGDTGFFAAMEFKATDVVINSISYDGTSGGGAAIEQVELEFKSAEIKIQQIDPSKGNELEELGKIGIPGPPPSGC